MSDVLTQDEANRVREARARSDDPAGIVICRHCRRAYHKSWGLICNDCSGAD